MNLESAQTIIERRDDKIERQANWITRLETSRTSLRQALKEEREDKVIRFIKLTESFWLRVKEIQAVEYYEHASGFYLKVYAANTTYDFSGEGAKNAWIEIQKIMELV